MRTTLNLPDALADEAKRRAAEEGRTLTSLVEEGLRLVLDLPRRSHGVELPSHGTGNGRVRVDVLDRNGLWEALDTDDPA